MGVVGPYRAFLESKQVAAPEVGFEATPEDLNVHLLPFQASLVRWALRRGRAALFERVGLGKTIQQLEWARLVHERTGGDVLILAPLAVAHQTWREGEKFGIGVTVCREPEDLRPGVNVTNYERLDLFDPAMFSGIVLDESSRLKGFGSRTRWQLNAAFRDTPYKLCCTATPAPNQHSELGTHAHFLGVMDHGEMLTRWFINDTTEARALRLKKHGERDFWRWVATWAACVNRPSDLRDECGRPYSDEGFDLPPLVVREHRVAVDHREVQEETGKLFRAAVPIAATELYAELRRTTPQRAAKAAEIVSREPHEPWLVWCNTNYEADEICKALRRELASGYWCETNDGDSVAYEMYRRHYSAGKEPKIKQFVGPGEKEILIGRDGKALFAWRRERYRMDGQTGVNCAVFRNESDRLSSDLILEAMDHAWRRWPGERLYTFVNPEKVASQNPGYCFQRAGWSRCGHTAGGLLIFEARPPEGHEAQEERREKVVEVRGNDKPDEKERKLLAFATGEVPILVTKPSIAGFGMNFQSCARHAFVGLSFSFEQFHQALGRSHRFGQTRPVEAHVITAETEQQVLETIHRKQKEHTEMQEKLVAATRENTKSKVGRADIGASAVKTETGEGWKLCQGDCVEVLRESVADDTVHLSIFSPPFSSLYSYSPSLRDMGNCADDEEFFEHFSHLVPELLRATIPGRLCCVHTKDLVRYKNRYGYGGLRDFTGEVTRAFEGHVAPDGTRWAYHSKVTIWTDPVREMQRTKRTALLYKTLKRDASYSAVGSPEYLVIFRKWTPEADSPEPIEHLPETDEEIPLEVWQRYASPVWTDIRRTDVLNTVVARENEDEKHLCPLQLGIIERCVELWSNPGDLVFDPFGGFASVGYQALQMGRRFSGVELKGSYFDQAIKFLKAVEDGAAQETLFAGVSSEVVGG